MHALTGLSGISGLIKSSDFDTPSAASYVERSGISNPTAAEDIDDAFGALQTEGLWDGLSVMWLGRSSYNAGSGTTVHEAKASTYNGTLGNGAGWSTNGMTFANTQYMSSAYMHDLTTNLVPFSFYMACKVVGDTAVNGRLWGSAAGATPTIQYLIHSNKAATEFGVYDGSAAFNNFVTQDVTSFHRWLVRYEPNGPVFNWYKDGSTTAFTGRGVSANGPSYPVYLNHPDSYAGHGTKTVALAAVVQGTDFTASMWNEFDSIAMTYLLSGVS